MYYLRKLIRNQIYFLKYLNYASFSISLTYYFADYFLKSNKKRKTGWYLTMLKRARRTADSGRKLGGVEQWFSYSVEGQEGRLPVIVLESSSVSCK
jgi:hypothetical protein